MRTKFYLLIIVGLSILSACNSPEPEVDATAAAEFYEEEIIEASEEIESNYFEVISTINDRLHIAFENNTVEKYFEEDAYKFILRNEKSGGLEFYLELVFDSEGWPMHGQATYYTDKLIGYANIDCDGCIGQDISSKLKSLEIRQLEHDSELNKWNVIWTHNQLAYKTNFFENNHVSNSNIALSNSEVTIGSQVWMTKNLNVDKFRNGDPIPHAKTNEEWILAGAKERPAWCYYDNDPANGEKYGKLYNWYAVNDPRGLAPKGWHVPSDEEWTVLVNYLGGIESTVNEASEEEDVAYVKLKSKNGWRSNNGTNESGFSGLPGGERSATAFFHDFGYDGHWWSSSDANKLYAWFRYMRSGWGNIFRMSHQKAQGYSVRCLRD